MYIVTAKPHGGSTMVRLGTDDALRIKRVIYKTAHCESCVGAPVTTLYTRLNITWDNKPDLDVLTVHSKC